jgi:hypothetical protein
MDPQQAGRETVRGHSNFRGKDSLWLSAAKLRPRMAQGEVLYTRLETEVIG